ncbi:MAG TPA: 3-octaprenyl-4-hydroxybenzoate carboxy-lyase [Flavobacteriales bacterium]|nr:3-octaprenyl-4-hydroxybenzoate carboxy-lyase [Flavobacteriales bacterium]|tara:strand:- start:44213 stop:44782 length:570 start_codon:yes stop_codon:yes gene_type:complete
MSATRKIKIGIGITGASGAIYAKTLLDELVEKPEVEVYVVMSDNAKIVWELELKNTDYKNYPFTFYDKNDFFSPLASGSAGWDAFIVVPCSGGTMARIANGVSDSLLTRAADVCLKERRKLILVLRETPYNLIHIQNMEKITLAGGIILPASPSFYHLPENITTLVKTVTDRIFSLCSIKNKGKKWGAS